MVRSIVSLLSLWFISAISVMTPLRAYGQEDDPHLLNRESVRLFQKGKYHEAIPLAEKVFAIDRQLLGPEHPDTVTALSNLAVLYGAVGDYDRATPRYEQLLAIKERLLGMEHPDTAVAMNNVALVYEETGDYAKAEKLYQAALEIRTKAVGRADPDTATTIYNLAGLYEHIGKYDKSESLYQEALRIRERISGPDRPETAAALNNLGFLYAAMGRYAEAKPFYERALQINTTVLGGEDPITATTLDNLASLCKHLGDYSRAESLFGQAIQIRKKRFGLEHRDTARSLGNLGQLYCDMGNYAEAEPLLRQALQIREKILGPEDVDTAVALGNLGSLYERKGSYTMALPLVERALQITTKILGADHPTTIVSAGNLGLLYEYMGEYAKAQTLLEKVVELSKRVLGAEHPDTAAALGNLGYLYWTIGDYAKAEPVCRQALEDDERILGPEHPETARNLGNLAGVYEAKFDLEKAEPLLRRALDINTKILGGEHDATLVSLNNLGFLYLTKGDYANAERLYRQALEVREKRFGLENPDTAASEHNLAVLYEAMGDYAKAEPLMQRALATSTNLLGREHLQTITALEDLAYLKFLLGRTDEARSLARLSDQAHSAILSKVLAFTSEPQRLAYEDIIHVNLYGLFTVLTGCEDDLASALLRFKGIVLDSVIEDRLIAAGSSRSNRKELVERLNVDRVSLGTLLLQTLDGAHPEIGVRANELEREIEQIEGQLAYQDAAVGQTRRALSVTLAKVQAKIPMNGALVEYLSYPFYLGKVKVEIRYGAIVILPHGDARWIPLGKADEIDSAVSQYQNLVRTAANEEELSANLGDLYERVFKPVQDALPPQVRRIILSPDGQLNFVSFATLLDPENRFVAETYETQYIASGRDLLRTAAHVQGRDVMLFGDPDFASDPDAGLAVVSGDAGTDVSAGPGADRRDLRRSVFGPLPGTQAECVAFARKFKDWSSNVHDPFLGWDATKQALLHLHSPYVLHIGTHGFFQAAEKPDSGIPGQWDLGRKHRLFGSRYFKNPMHRSGLALAGAQRTLDAWNRGEVPPIQNDGIVTAEDIATIDLKDTWLVTLSACDTGSGEAKAGEGVLGMRRAFLEAGAENLLMTLWPISDEPMVNVISDFYERAREAGDAPTALAQVQRDWLLRTREEHGLSRAVHLAGPFVMSSQGSR